MKAKLIALLTEFKSGANIFGSRIWNRNNDLNWAMQQIRPIGKPAGNIEKYNVLAEKMLNKYVPNLSVTEAGILVKDVHNLTYQYIGKLISEGQWERTEARSYVFGLVTKYVGKPETVSD